MHCSATRRVAKGWGSALVAGLVACTLTAPVRASDDDDDDDRIPFPIGVSARHTPQGSASGVELGIMGFAFLSRPGLSLACDFTGTLGSDGNRATGTLATSFGIGTLIGTKEPRAQGLALRGGFSVLVDGLGDGSASQLALPALQVGYAYGGSSLQLDFGFQAAPVLAGRFRVRDARRPLGLGVESGGYAGVLLPRIGLSARLSVDRLLASTAGRGATDWSRGLLCFSSGSIDACAHGFVARFVALPSTSTTVYAYAGLMIGINFAKAGQAFIPSVR